MRIWLKRAAIALLLAIISALLLGYWLLRGSLPALDGAQPLPGLAAAATVRRDAQGTATIEAASETDALRALGFLHAQERYFEMDLMRRSAAGELSELFGAIAIDLDKRHRRHRLRARVQRDLDLIIGDRRAQIEAYVAGVNAGLAALRSRPWPYLLLRQQPQPWRLEDTPLAAFAMYFDLQGGENKDELALWRLQPHLPPALFDLLAHDGTRWDAPMEGVARGPAHLPDAALVNLRTLPSDAVASTAREPADSPGSNNFAVSGALTRDGRAIVADDMHLGLRAPNIWFRARLRYSDLSAGQQQVDVQGVTLPGLPAVVAGSNGHVAWGFTNSYIDTMDWKREHPCGPQATPGCAPLRTVQEHIRVAGAAPVQLEVQETDWGPVLERDPDGSVLTLRWVAHQPGALNLGLSRFATARDLDQVLALARDVAMPTQNLLAADTQGRIVWRLLGPIPQRAAGCATTTGAEALGPTQCPPWAISTQDNPHLRSPALDRMWTANARVVDGETLAKVGDGGYALGARQAQIRDDLRARQRFNERDLLAIQLDDRALLLTPWHGLLLERARTHKTPALQALATAASTWEGRASVTSVSYRIVRAWRLAVHARIADGLTAPARATMGKAFVMPSLTQLEGVVWPLVSQRPTHLLPRRFASWEALFEDAAAEVRHDLEQQGPLAQRAWGERNMSAICHPLASAIPWLGKRLLCMPAQPLAGDGDMPRVAGPAFGASERMVVSPGHEADGILHMPGGQSGHPLSPFWGAGHDDWVEGKPSPFLPGIPRHTLTLQPASR